MNKKMSMKKLFGFSFVLGIVFCTTAFQPISEQFEGTIRYETTVTGEVPRAVTDRLCKYYDLSIRKNELKIKGTAPLLGEIFIKTDVQKMYIVRADQKNVYEVDLNDKRIPENTLTPKVTLTREMMTVAGYSCQEYQIEYDSDMKLNVWTTSAIQAEHLIEAPVFGGKLKLPDGVAGFPLKLQLVFSGFTMTLTATVVDVREMNATEFAIPAGMTMQKL
jgi:hypothetical protein